MNQKGFAHILLISLIGLTIVLVGYILLVGFPENKSCGEELACHGIPLGNSCLGYKSTFAYIDCSKSNTQVLPSIPRTPAASSRVASPNTKLPTSTSNWLTYKSSNYGYEIKYPSSWNFVEAMSSPPPFMYKNRYTNTSSLAKDQLEKISLEQGTPGIGEIFQVSVKSNLSGLTLTQIASSDSSYQSDTQTEVTVAGSPALKLEEPSGPPPYTTAYFLVLHKSYLYTISFPDINSDITDPNYALTRTINSQIFSTFKFDN